ncbi:2-phosphosulfolactate phosphatase [Streptomyces sp. NPDC087440]|uniref:2-phosphosulfolactate phosphatase n=1 Tax=Streptomyces sp. NPDC087440 TaxID=3365790 RepID=UPI003811817E
MDHVFAGIPELAGAPVPRTAVVIDVMRAFTVAAWAFERGAEKIVLAATLDEALALKSANPGWLALKDGALTEGFDAVNSPALLRSAELSGRTVVQKTTAGTVGALAVADAPLILCASFVVAGATARVLRERGAAEVTYVVTGEDGRADEDLACAEYIAAHAGGGEAEAEPYVKRARDSRAAEELATGVRSGSHPEDVGLCVQTDRFAFAMEARREGPLMVLRPVVPHTDV